MPSGNRARGQGLPLFASARVRFLCLARHRIPTGTLTSRNRFHPRGDNPRVVSNENGERPPGRVLRPSAFVVGLQGMRQHVDIGLGRRIFHRQPIGLPQRSSVRTAHHQTIPRAVSHFDLSSASCAVNLHRLGYANAISGGARLRRRELSGAGDHRKTRAGAEGRPGCSRGCPRASDHFKCKFGASPRLADLKATLGL